MLLLLTAAAGAVECQRNVKITKKQELVLTLVYSTAAVQLYCIYCSLLYLYCFINYYPSSISESAVVILFFDVIYTF
jgi:hypothetical protein